MHATMIDSGTITIFARLELVQDLFSSLLVFTNEGMLVNKVGAVNLNGK